MASGARGNVRGNTTQTVQRTPIVACRGGGNNHGRSELRKVKAIIELHWLDGKQGKGADRHKEVEHPTWRRDRALEWDGRWFEHCATRPDGVWVYRDNRRP